jgi:hypothetical protein
MLYAFSDIDMKILKILSVVKIQRCFRHFIEGRIIRKKMKYTVNKICTLKSFVVACKLDSINFLSKNYKDYVKNVYGSIEIWLHQDSDDESDVSFSEEQLLIIKNIREKKHIFFKDIKNLLKALTLNQLEFI